MPAPPDKPSIYHIVHADRLPSILADDCLWCDAVMVNRPQPGTVIGMSNIKSRRLAMPVDCHPGTMVGGYVPFYFCPRSFMLYIIWMANHPELAYRGGQGPIIHLEADLQETVSWAEQNGRQWAFTPSNASAHYTPFRNNLAELGEINWPAVASHDFRSSEIKQGKQAEFLMRPSFPWSLVREVGVQSRAIGQQVVQAMAGVVHRPPVRVRPEWYY